MATVDYNPKVTATLFLGTRSDGERAAHLDIWCGTALARFTGEDAQAILGFLQATPQSYWHDLGQQVHAHLTFADLPTPETLFASPEEEAAELRAWTKAR